MQSHTLPSQDKKAGPNSGAQVDRIQRGLEELAALATQSKEHAPAISELVGLYAETLRNGRTIFFIGNGGSAADAQHIATEYVVRFRNNRRAFAAIALTTDTSLLTATGNDLSFDQIFSRQIEALCKAGDLLVIHSTSGESPNLLQAAAVARAASVKVIALLGKGGGRLNHNVDASIVIGSNSTSHIQEIQLAIQHLICESVEADLLGS